MCKNIIPTDMYSQIQYSVERVIQTSPARNMSDYLYTPIRKHL